MSYLYTLDFTYHFTAGFILYIILRKLGERFGVTPIVGIALVIVIGLWKELVDLYIQGTFFDIRDFLSTAVAGFAASGSYELSRSLWQKIR